MARHVVLGWILSRRELGVWQGWAWAIFVGSVLYAALADVTIRRTRRLRAVAAATTLCDSALLFVARPGTIERQNLIE